MTQGLTIGRGYANLTQRRNMPSNSALEYDGVVMHRWLTLLTSEEFLPC